jgi:hypothetical protein
MAAHAQFAPSSAATWLHCSWSARNAPAQELKPQSTIEKADEGTRMHAVLERAARDGTMPNEPEDFRVASLYVDFIRQLEQGVEIFVEQRVWLRDDCWGTVDLYGRHSQITTVMDFKNGRWDVFAEKNKQMLTYAAMELDTNKAEWWRFVIFQPNGLQVDDDPFRQWVAHRSEVEAHKAQMLAAINDTSGPKPGPHCRWCKAFQTCPAMSDDAAFLRAAMSRPIEGLTTEEIVRMLRMIRALNDVKKVYEDALLTHLKLGRTADGAGMAPKRSFRAWNDDRQAAAYLFQQFGEKAVKPVSPAEAEKLGPAGKAYAAIGAHKPAGELVAKY